MLSSSQFSHCKATACECRTALDRIDSRSEEEEEEEEKEDVGVKKGGGEEERFPGMTFNNEI